jgi:hypothetical protein
MTMLQPGLRFSDLNGSQSEGRFRSESSVGALGVQWLVYKGCVSVLATTGVNLSAPIPVRSRESFSPGPGSAPPETACWPPSQPPSQA